MALKPQNKCIFLENRLIPKLISETFNQTFGILTQKTGNTKNLITVPRIMFGTQQFERTQKNHKNVKDINLNKIAT